MPVSRYVEVAELVRIICVLAHFQWVPSGDLFLNGYERCSCWGCCYQIFNVSKRFHFSTDRN